jgi:hypothetical protein
MPVMNRIPNHQRHMSPVNAWPWRGWQGYGGSRGHKEG